MKRVSTVDALRLRLFIRRGHPMARQAYRRMRARLLVQMEVDDHYGRYPNSAAGTVALADDDPDTRARAQAFEKRAELHRELRQPRAGRRV